MNNFTCIISHRHTHVYIYIYIYIERERMGGREREHPRPLGLKNTRPQHLWRGNRLPTPWMFRLWHSVIWGWSCCSWTSENVEYSFTFITPRSTLISVVVSDSVQSMGEKEMLYHLLYIKLCGKIIDIKLNFCLR